MCCLTCNYCGFSISALRKNQNYHKSVMLCWMLE
jgi:hypothetical protein